MAVVMSMHWPETSLDQYERVRKDVKWETNVPKGAMFHVAWMAGDGFRVIDIWESEGDFQRFNEARLVPAIQRHALPGTPTVTFSPAHAIFAPKVPAPAGAPRRASTIRKISRAARPTARKAKASSRRAKKAAPRRRGKR
jgi:hypothetical protein